MNADTSATEPAGTTRKAGLPPGRPFFMRLYVASELKEDEAAIRTYIELKLEEALAHAQPPGRAISEPVVDWHQIEEGESLPLDAFIWRDLHDGMVMDESTAEPLVVAGDWRAIVSVRAEVDG